ncbi:MAG TPA: FG-GAP-like repeat-containing protein [Polyangiaceae bacterium]
MPKPTVSESRASLRAIAERREAASCYGKPRSAVLGTMVTLAVTACGAPGAPGTVDSREPNTGRIQLVDITESAFGRYIDPGDLAAAQIAKATGDQPVGQGAAIGDLDGDGDLDIVLARAADRADTESLLLVNHLESGRLWFSEDLSFSELTNGRPAVGVALGDYDSDGDLDVFLACAGTDLLLRNRGDGTFEDVAEAAGVAGPPDDVSAGAIWVDVNNDGLLDLVVYNFFTAADQAIFVGGCPTQISMDRLYLNRGDGSFTDATVASELTKLGATHALAAADLDDDGRLDLYACNDTGARTDGVVLYPNPLPDNLWVYRDLVAGVPRFRDVAPSWGLSTSRASMGMALFDVDGDGRLDLYISDIGDKPLFVWNQSDHSYRDVASSYGLEAKYAPGGGPAVSWGVLALDLNRNGRLEMLVINGSLNGAPEQKNAYLEQIAPDGPFAPIPDAAGLNDVTRPWEIQWARGAYHGDLDRDGDEDVLLGVREGSFRVFENRSERQGEALRLRLIGTVSAPDPVGARVTVVLAEQDRIAAQHTAGGQPYGQSDSVMELVTGNRRATGLEIEWPSGFVERLPSTELDPEMTVLEPRWLTVTPRRIFSGEQSELRYVAFGESGNLLGAAGAGRQVEVERSDGIPVSVTDAGDGSYSAELSHPGQAGVVSLEIRVDGQVQKITPLLFFK